MMNTYSNGPLVSVVIPTYSRPDNLVRAIESVLSQSYRNIEIIVVDDNGIGTRWQIETENMLLKYINNHKVRYIKHETNRNGSAARNTGLSEAKGEYINFLDDDDEFLPDRIEKCIDVILKSADLGAVFSNTIFRNGNNERVFINPLFENPAQDLLLAKLIFNTSTLLFKADAVKAIGGFDESFVRHQDYELTIRFCERYKIANVNDSFIIKNASENIVTKYPAKRYEHMRYFIDTFKSTILSWPKGKAVIRHQYEVVARFMFASGYPKLGFKCFGLISQYGMPSWYSIARCSYHLFRTLMTFKIKFKTV